MKYSREEIAEMELLDKCKKIGLPEDASKFIEEWLPEYEPMIDDELFYDISWQVIRVMDDEELKEFLDWQGVTEEKYENESGSIYRDAAFVGNLVMGE